MNKEMIEKIQNADAILIGASNGYSITEGIHLFANNEAFQSLFGDFQRKYGVSNLLTGMLGRWPDEKEMWAFWSRLVNHYYNAYEPGRLMENLKNIIGDKDYFIVTSNGEQHFEKAGFDDAKIFEIEGDWTHIQCANHCHVKRYNWTNLAKEMSDQQIDGRIPDELVPHCPVCGNSMIPNMAAGHSFIPKEGVQDAYQNFLNKYHNQNIVILELGIGWRNQLIKAPFMKLTEREPNATYITINLGEIYIIDSIQSKSYGLDGYLDEILQEISDELQ